MTREIAEIVEEVQRSRVFTVEEGGVWFSGINANVGRLVEEVRNRLREEGYDVDGITHEDRGLFLHVSGAEEVDNDTLDEVVGVRFPPRPGNGHVEVH